MNTKRSKTFLANDSNLASMRTKRQTLRSSSIKEETDEMKCPTSVKRVFRDKKIKSTLFSEIDKFSHLNSPKREYYHKIKNFTLPLLNKSPLKLDNMSKLNIIPPASERMTKRKIIFIYYRKN